MKIGICTSIGRQEASGLTPISFWSLRISIACVCWSLEYFERISCIRGCISCILRPERSWLIIGFSRMTRIVTTRKMIDSAQVTPESGSRMRPQALCQNHRTHEIG
jgi:hypothetical protein